MIKLTVYIAVFGGAALAVVGFIAVLAGAVTYTVSLAWHLGGGC